MIPIDATDLAAMLDGLEQCRDATVSKGWLPPALRELAWSIHRFSDPDFLEEHRDFATAGLGFGGWYSVLLFFGELTREQIVGCATRIDPDSAEPFVDVPAAAEAQLDEADRRLRVLWRKGPSVLQDALVSIANDVLRMGGRGLHPEPPARPPFGKLPGGPQA